MARFARYFYTALAVVLAVLVLYAVYRLERTHLEAGIYRERLATLSRDYQHLRSTYNQAVGKTAVTELEVKDGKLTVNVRTIEGLARCIDTPFDPAREIYVDYVVLDGRLWVRRVFDAQTPPEKGLLIDNQFEQVNWDAPGYQHGKAVYRTLGEGRWVISVTGDGALGLTKVEGDAKVELSPPPQVRDYEQIEQEVEADLDRIGPIDLIAKMLGR